MRDQAMPKQTGLIKSGFKLRWGRLPLHFRIPLALLLAYALVAGTVELVYRLFKPAQWTTAASALTSDEWSHSVLLLDEEGR